MKNYENLFYLNERFLHLAQNILCDKDAAKEVSDNVIAKIETQFKKEFSSASMLKIFDEEIERFFQELITQIRAGSEKSRKLLFKILDKRFSYLLRKKISFDINLMDREDANDILQNSLITIFQKLCYAKPKGTFIQWAQTILLNKYKEYRRRCEIKNKRIKRLLQDQFEPIYFKTISKVISKRKTEKQVKTLGLDSTSSIILNTDPFEEDPYDWKPSILVESSDLKYCLLKIIGKMEEPCKRIFKALFAEGDVQAVHKQFPNLTRSQIDVLICRCRQKLKKEAIKRSIL